MSTKSILTAAGIATLATLAIWQATGGDYYTKFEVVETVESKIDPNDPLAAAGFYEGGSTEQTVTRSEFRLGLLPTPAGLIDKHWLSVAPILTAVWGLSIVAIWRRRKRKRAVVS